MILVKVLASKSFHRSKLAFVASIIFRQSQVSEIGFKVFNQRFGEFGSGFFVRLFFSGKGFASPGHFFQQAFWQVWLWRFCTSAVLVFAKSTLPKIL
jgi:hypothetical protein